jgi:hypothetical protein
MAEHGQCGRARGQHLTLALADNTPGDLRRETGRILVIGGAERATVLFGNGFE